ncbi:alpha/beta hydrolase family protein [Saccharibacillus deserti]|uniref:alpha/beta hydrolase family protein n=1 Tax=Saccharibacillus deserti TaxID=1634444 RepID=UPI0015564737|nr:alpha/beta fold hydrolase [Saccharibacillus deserti]
MKKTGKKKLWIAGASLLLALAALAVWAVVGNTYRMEERPVVIETPQGRLTGTLALPESPDGPVGLIVFVHGDGPTNSTYDDGYKPLWEAFAAEGYASLSLDKRGVGGSEGDWLDQDMEDRAQDTQLAIDWARSQPEIDRSRIGLWGASQAGWVIPKIVRGEPDLAFSILVAPAVNWIEQGRYHTRRTMERSGSSAEEIAAAERKNADVLKLLRRGASYEEYLREAALKDTETLSRERWTFILKNFESDSAAELSAFKHPVHLVLGGQDLNVDSDDTETVYRAHIPAELLSVTQLPEADHSMLKRGLAESETLTTLTAIWMPKKLFDDGYLSDMRQFLRTMEKTQTN